MASRHSYFWKWIQWKWTQPLLIGLLMVSLFAPLPDTLGKILTLAIAVPLLVFWGAIEWEDRRERKADQSSSAAISSSDQT